MVKTENLEEPLIPSDVDIEGLRDSSEDYIALPRAAEATTSQERAFGHALPQSTRPQNAILFMSICWAAVVLLVIGAFVSYIVIARGKELYHGGGEEFYNGGGEEFYNAEKTAFHFQPIKNWMNDPNGPLYYQGYYHLFYQWNPHGSVWGDIVWGHAVSTDLVHWNYLDVALEADQWYDRGGVWSGSATLLEDGTPALLYTGAEAGGNAQTGWIETQNLAVPVDPSDPLLRKWKKSITNPLILNPVNVRPQDFRDPTTAWLESDGLWRIAIGAKRDNTDGTRDGISFLYTSPDFEHWDSDGELLHEVAGTGMWECIDFYPVLVQGKVGANHSVLTAENYVDTYKYVLKASMDDTRHDHYAIGEYSLRTHKFIPDDPALDVGIGYRYDYGKFYASKTFYDTLTSRRILWGWANESDSEQDDVIKGWSSVMTLPRTIWLDGQTTKNILQWPVKEVEALRGEMTRHDNILLKPTEIVQVKGGDGPQLDILVEFEKPMHMSNMNGSELEDEEFDCSQGGSAHRGVFGPFGILVNTDDELIEQTAIFFYLTYSMAAGQWTTQVCSDQSRSSKAAGLDKTVYGTFVTILPHEDTLALRVLVDHSIVETFVQGGRLAITSRVYPTVALNSKSHMFVFNNATVPIVMKSITVYKMNKVTMNFI